MRCDDKPENLGDDPDEPEEPVECPTCGGPAGVLGVLGALLHYCCRECGWIFSRSA